MRPRRAYFGQKDAQQAAVVRRIVRDLNLDRRDPRAADRPRRRRARAVVAQRATLAGGARAQRSPSPRPRRGAEAYHRGGDPVAATRSSSNGLDPDYVELLELDGVTILAAAVRVGGTRLIDNVLLKGELT